MEKSRIIFGWIGRNQMDLFSIYREYIDTRNNIVIHADIVFTIETPIFIRKLVWKHLGWAAF